MFADTTKSRTTVTYLATGALAFKSANADDEPIVHDCNLAWLLAAMTTPPNCAKCHVLPLYPPDLDTSSSDKSVASSLNSLVAPPAKIATSSPYLEPNTEFRFSLALPEKSSALAKGAYPIEVGYTFFASRSEVTDGWSGNHSSNCILCAGILSLHDKC